MNEDVTELTLLPPEGVQARTEISDQEMVKRGEMFNLLARKYNLPDDLREDRVNLLTLNIGLLQGIADHFGINYGHLGIVPHRLDLKLVQQLTHAGSLFLEGAANKYQYDKHYLDAGIDIFKSATVELDSDLFEELKVSLSPRS